MAEKNSLKVGFTCANTPLPIIEAAGFSPHRILPMGDCPDLSGRHLHDNLCPHVKKSLDAALSGDMPDIAGMVFMNSCDAMRRMADAWRALRPNDPLLLLDLPATTDSRSISFFADELRRMAKALAKWSGAPFDDSDAKTCARRFNTLCGLMESVCKKYRSRRLEGGAARIQELRNMASMQSAIKSLAVMEEIDRKPLSDPPKYDSSDPDAPVPVFLFGNAMPDPKAFELFESCGIHIVGDDLCTGSRMFQPICLETETEDDPAGDIYLTLARGIMRRPPCARTFSAQNPGAIAEDILSGAKACGARAVMGHILKFCDPYLDRLPMIRSRMKEENIPLLLLEGDCTLRSVGQQGTRIEAFVEMLR